MAKTVKLGEGLYRTEDKKYQISQVGEQYLLAELQNNRYIVVATARTLAQAEKELTKLNKTEEPAPEIEVETVVAETTEEKE